MLAIFNKGQFVGFWGNKASDNFLNVTCERMKWNPNELAVFNFDSFEERISSIELSGNIKRTCDIQGNLLLQRVSFQEVPMQITVYPWEEALAKELFLDSEIEQAKINKLFLDQNPDTLPENLPYPNAVMTSKQKWIIKKQEVLTDIETIVGTPIDVLVKIAEEGQV